MGVSNAALNLLRDWAASISTSGVTTATVTSPNFMQIGTGSYTFNAGSDALQTVFSGAIIGSTGIIKTDKTVTYEAFWSATQLSGATISEMGLRTGSTASAGSLWVYNAFSGTTFDGSKELTVDIDVQFSTS